MIFFLTWHTLNTQRKFLTMKKHLNTQSFKIWLGWAMKSLTTQHSTRPFIVQVMSWYMCRAHIALSESKCQRGYLAHIAPSEPMTNIVQQGTSLNLYPTSLFPKTPTIKKDLVSNAVRCEAAINIQYMTNKNNFSAFFLGVKCKLNISSLRGSSTCPKRNNSQAHISDKLYLRGLYLLIYADWPTDIYINSHHLEQWTKWY